jgi:hypothetical protein
MWKREKEIERETGRLDGCLGNLGYLSIKRKHIIFQPLTNK